MPVTVTYPGVYVQEVPSGVRTIAGVATSTGMFVGASSAGPIDAPTLVTSYTDYVKVFGADSTAGEMARYVKLFFLNGGTTAYVMRLQANVGYATVSLENEAGVAVLDLTAVSPGSFGEDIRAIVRYSGAQPEATFDIELFRWDRSGPVPAKADVELWAGLTMNPNAASYAPDVLTQNSNLVNAAAVGAPAAVAGESRAMRVVEYDPADVADYIARWTALAGDFQIRVGSSNWTVVSLPVPAGANVAAAQAAYPGAVKSAIDTALGAASVTVSLSAGPTAMTAGLSTEMLTISAMNAGDDVYIRPAAANDCTVRMMMGTAQGGIERSAHSGHRPAPTGVSLAPTDAMLAAFADQQNNDLDEITVDSYETATGTAAAHALAVDLTQGGSGATDRVWHDTISANNSNGLLEKLGYIRDAINGPSTAPPAGHELPWRAELVGYRLVITPTERTVTPAVADDNRVMLNLATSPDNITTNFGAAAAFTENARYYTVGALGAGAGGYQVNPGAAASDGDPPTAAEYDNAYTIIRRAVDLFNIMVLPPSNDSAGGAATPVADLYPNASVFCQSERAFLVMDPPPAWTGVQTPLNEIAAQRVGLVNDHAAMYYPNIVIREGGRDITVGPSGAIAGLYARTDGQRGVWKAPAGTSAELRGVVGVAQQMSDVDNGIINPVGLNAIRTTPNGIVSWGARTMDGADAFGSEYKYVPIRRLALNIEESLYRGLQWVVFEPNNDALYAQIRMNVGAYMKGLYRNGAFFGATPSEAFFVKCDRETTTDTDRELGIVNIWVGFRPVRPAEFVVLYLQQMAGEAA